MKTVFLFIIRKSNAVVALNFFVFRFVRKGYNTFCSLFFKRFNLVFVGIAAVGNINLRYNIKLFFKSGRIFFQGMKIIWIICYFTGCDEMRFIISNRSRGVLTKKRAKRRV